VVVVKVQGIVVLTTGVVVVIKVQQTMAHVIVSNLPW
jgi:hypothetical protein